MLSLLIRGQKIKKYFKLHKIHKLQIGAWENLLPGWLNTDFEPRRESVFLDARRRFPFADNTFDYIFCEHLLEHLEYKDGIQMLNESLRVLRPGGRIRIATPDINFLIDLYNKKKTSLQERYIIWAVDSYMPGIGIYQDIFVINNFFHAWGHKFIYDFNTLQDVMIKLGFVDIVRYDTGESSDENFHGLELHGKHINSEFNKLESFVIEGTKPN